MYARTDFTLLTHIVQCVGQSGCKLFPPAGLRKESNHASLFGYSLIVLISSLTVLIASRHIWTFETASWKTRFICGHYNARTLPVNNIGQPLVCQDCCQRCFRTIGGGDLGPIPFPPLPPPPCFCAFMWGVGLSQFSFGLRARAKM